jgi:hypothetical protein
MSDKMLSGSLAREGARREYTAPTLANYGSLANLTRGGSFVGNDGNTQCVGNAGDPDQCPVS